ncbi:H-NS family nucleoid-associated regulatory protein [Cupriavidus agavae]|uniref:DNA-binding protein H-NS n=1 Tax=Cupriavidus agavae TaxID=1001822 RepID=A0A4Q7RP93_9BURK|nr:H-NS family nucleoid-associated regulatory protein [Cupriavidus agavae]RZT35461.1 DNA-binding protein H-NS [Cupriavidus agavae]
MHSAKSIGAPQALLKDPLSSSQELVFGRAKADAILWIRTTMARNGITFAQLLETGCFEAHRFSQRTNAKVKYKDAAGHTWDGMGEMPEWLQRATHKGQTVDHFKVD